MRAVQFWNLTRRKVEKCVATRWKHPLRKTFYPMKKLRGLPHI